MNIEEILNKDYRDKLYQLHEFVGMGCESLIDDSFLKVYKESKNETLINNTIDFFLSFNDSFPVIPMILEMDNLNYNPSFVHLVDMNEDDKTKLSRLIEKFIKNGCSFGDISSLIDTFSNVKSDRRDFYVTSLLDSIIYIKENQEIKEKNTNFIRSFADTFVEIVNLNDVSVSTFYLKQYLLLLNESKTYASILDRGLYFLIRSEKDNKEDLNKSITKEFIHDFYGEVIGKNNMFDEVVKLYLSNIYSFYTYNSLEAKEIYLNLSRKISDDLKKRTIDRFETIRYLAKIHNKEKKELNKLTVGEIEILKSCGDPTLRILKLFDDFSSKDFIDLRKRTEKKRKDIDNLEPDITKFFENILCLQYNTEDEFHGNVLVKNDEHSPISHFPMNNILHHINEIIMQNKNDLHTIVASIYDNFNPSFFFDNKTELLSFFSDLYSIKNKKLKRYYLETQQKVSKNNYLNCLAFDKLFMKLYAGKNENLSDFLDNINLALDYNMGFEGDFINLYGNQLLGKKLDLDQQTRLDSILVFMDGIILAKNEINKYFNQQKVVNGILDISKKTKYWYKLKEQARNFTAEKDYMLNLSIFDDFFKVGFGKSLEDKVNVVDLGCGDGKKAITFYNKLNASYLYFVDDSEQMLKYALINAKKENIIAGRKNIDLEFLHYETFEELQEQNVYLFLGQTLGNFEKPEKIIRNISGVMKNNDYLIIEVDLEKDLKKYKSKQTEEFLGSYVSVLDLEDKVSKPEIIEDKEGIKAYYTLKEDHENLKKGTKLLIAESRRFDKDNLIKMFSQYNLKSSERLLYETNGELIGVFYKQ